MDNIFFGTAIFCTGLFLVQFVMSTVLGGVDLDTDIDIDSDGVGDFNFGDLLSFKGLLHFLIGFSWTMWFAKDINKFYSALLAVGIGVIFMIVLAFTYYLATKLKNEVKEEKGEALVSRTVSIYLYMKDVNAYKVNVSINNSHRIIQVKSKENLDYKFGDTTQIISYENGTYYIP